jgi:hypothetical protein
MDFGEIYYWDSYLHSCGSNILTNLNRVQIGPFLKFNFLKSQLLLQERGTEHKIYEVSFHVSNFYLLSFSKLLIHNEKQGK